MGIPWQAVMTRPIHSQVNFFVKFITNLIPEEIGGVNVVLTLLPRSHGGAEQKLINSQRLRVSAAALGQDVHAHFQLDPSLV